MKPNEALQLFAPLGQRDSSVCSGGSVNTCLRLCYRLLERCAGLLLPSLIVHADHEQP